MAGIREQHDKPRAHPVAKRLIYFIKRQPGGVQILWIGIVRDEVPFPLLGDYAVAREKDVHDVVRLRSLGEPMAQRCTDRSDGRALFRQQQQMVGGKGAPLRAAQEPSNLLRIAIRELQLCARRKILVLRYANHHCPPRSSTGHVRRLRDGFQPKVAPDLRSSQCLRESQEQQHGRCPARNACGGSHGFARCLPLCARLRQ